MFDYTSIRALAEGQIREYGRTMTLIRPSATGFDPETGAYAAGTSTEYEVVGISTKFSRKEIDGTFVQAADQKVLLAADTISTVPTVSDLLKIGEETWSILQVQEVSPGGTVLLYTLQIRK